MSEEPLPSRRFRCKDCGAKCRTGTKNRGTLDQCASCRRRDNSVEGQLYRELQEQKRLTFAALSLIADIRSAVGDPTGKLMQDELVEHCRYLYASQR